MNGSFVRRACWALTLVLLPQASFAQDPLTESRVIEIAKSATPTSIVTTAVDSLERAREETAGRFLNPSIAWARESVGNGPVASQDIVAATLPIQVFRPLTTRSLAASESAWRRAESSDLRSEAVLTALMIYYDVVLLEMRLELLAESAANLEEAARVLALREEVGNSSGYESSRLAIASELLRSRQAEVNGALLAARVRLVVLMGLSGPSVVVASSLPLLSEAEERRLAGLGIEDREAVTLARLSETHAKKARERAQWTWLPTLQLEAGFKHVSDLGGMNGYIVGIGLELPVFDSAQGLRQQAYANAELATARVDSLRRIASAEEQESLALYRAARAELARFESSSQAHIDTLLAAAKSGYREGERSIVELLDAQRAQTDVAERRLTLLGKTKSAEARLRAATGEFK